MRGRAAGREAEGMTTATDRLLQGVLVLTLLVCGAGAVLGFYFIGQDMEAQGEFLDGIGILIGLAILFLVGAPAVLAGWALRLSVTGRRHAGRWAVAAGVTGLLLGAPFGISYRPFLAFLAAPLLLVVVALTTRPAAR
jgi:hypothetical protein